MALILLLLSAHRLLSNVSGLTHLWLSVPVRLQLLIGFESGTIVQWDLRAKKADFRIYYDEVSPITQSSASKFNVHL